MQAWCGGADPLGASIWARITRPRPLREQEALASGGQQHQAECLGKRLGSTATLKAMLVACEGEEAWIPTSQVHEDSEVNKPGTEGTLVIPRWVAEIRSCPTGKRGQCDEGHARVYAGAGLRAHWMRDSALSGSACSADARR